MMNVLQEKHTRCYVTFLLCFSAAILLLVLFFSWFHGKEMQRFLYEREQVMVSALLEQDVPQETIAGALKSLVSTEEGMEFLKQIGHTDSASFLLFPWIRQSVRWFALMGFVMAGVMAASLLLTGIRFFLERERLYRMAERVITQFSDGNFEEHLPQNESGAVFQVFAATEELAMELQAQNEKEQHAKEFLKHTISDISHQLKTPLAALKMYMEIISEEPDHAEIVQRFSEKSMGSLDRMEQLIQSLLKITRLDAESIDFQKRVLPVSELVSCAMEPLAVRAEQERKQIILRGNANDQIFCDPQWTGEAIGNLIKNALDHTWEGGTIQIAWERSPAMVRLSVSDDGCGISQEDIHHIFKRFYRSKNMGSRPKHQGVGLGLPLAKAIVEGQGGSLLVRSEWGQGTVFTITFLTES